MQNSTRHKLQLQKMEFIVYKEKLDINTIFHSEHKYDLLNLIL